MGRRRGGHYRYWGEKMKGMRRSRKKKKKKLMGVVQKIGKTRGTIFHVVLSLIY